MTIEAKNQKLPDSGARDEFTTGAVREPNPLRFDLIPLEPMERLALHYGNGARKYADRNWEKGLPMSRCFSSAVGHLFQYIRDKAIAHKGAEDHLAAAAWNIFALMTYEARIDQGAMSSDIDDISPSYLYDEPRTSRNVY